MPIQYFELDINMNEYVTQYIKDPLIFNEKYIVLKNILYNRK